MLQRRKVLCNTKFNFFGALSNGPGKGSGPGRGHGDAVTGGRDQLQVEVVDRLGARRALLQWLRPSAASARIGAIMQRPDVGVK